MKGPHIEGKVIIMKNNNTINATANVTTASIMDSLGNESMGRVYHIVCVGRKNHLADAAGLYDKVYTKDEAKRNAEIFGITYKLTETGSDLLKLVRKGVGITHGGIFHADEVFATALMRMINPNFKVQRVFNVPNNADVLVYDIGRGKYDHHEKDEDKERRENGIPYASFGKLWRDIAPEIFGDDIYKAVDASLVQGIDAVDNGVKDTHNEISSLIHDFNPMWNETWTTPEVQFQKSVELAYQILWRKIQGAMSVLEAKDKVQKALDSRVGDKKIMVLNEYVPYYDYINEEKELLYVVYPSIRGGWNVQTVPTTPGGRIAKMDVPEIWKGYDMKVQLKETYHYNAPLDGMTFCHSSGFVTAFETKDQAIWAAIWLCGKRDKVVKCYFQALHYEYDPCSGYDEWYTNYASEQQLMSILMKKGYEGGNGRWNMPNDPYENWCSYEVVNADDAFRWSLHK